MAAKTPKKAIRDALANLSKINFESFCEELLDRREEPQVQRTMVEDKSRLVVGNVLVETFTEDNAPGVVVELLRNIGCHEEAVKLAKETGGQSPKPGSSDTVRTSAGATGVNTMAEGVHFVDKHSAELIEKVSNVASIMDVLLNKEVLTQAKYDEILALRNTRDMMRKLYSGPLNAAGREGKDVFYKLLEKNEKYLMADLKNNK